MLGTNSGVASDNRNMQIASNANPILSQATNRFLAGEINESETLCAQFLEVSPHHPLGLFLHGLVLIEQQKPEAALPLVQHAVLLEPGNFSFHLTLAGLWRRLNQIQKARESLLTAFRLCPGNVGMLLDLATNLRDCALLREARYCLEQAICLDPNTAAAHHDLGEVLAMMGEAESAIKSYRCALKCDPGEISSCNNIANLLVAQGRSEEAEQFYVKGLTINPNHAETCFNLANLYAAKDRFEDAVMLYRKAVAVRPDFHEAWDSLGLALNDSGRNQEALVCFDRAAELKPDWLQPVWNRAITRLKIGRYEEGWVDYESRLKIPRITSPRTFQSPRWDGQPFRGQRLLLVAEQGLGDTIQFVRFVSLAKAFGGEVLFECQPELARLMRLHPHVDRVFVRGERLPPHDWHSPLMSLPSLLKTTLDTIPKEVPYFRIESVVELSTSRILRVGLAWAGNPKHCYDHRRSCRFADLSELLATEGIEWVNLQQTIPEEDLSALGEQPEMLLKTYQFQDLYSTAQWIRSLDLVISVDTAVAHLAGSLNIPVWILLSSASDWRWLTEREDSPWYPSAVLFRQKSFGDWKEVALRVKTRLEDLLRTWNAKQGLSSFPPSSDLVH
jgi:tetratricopeptide (TPR) repeat protein